MGKKERKIFRSYAMIVQISISMMVPIFLSAGIGWWLNRQFHTQIWFLILLFIGIGAAFQNVYKITRSFYASDLRREQEQLQYLQDLKEYSQKHPAEEFSEEPVKVSTLREKE